MKEDRFLSWMGFALALGLCVALPGCDGGGSPTSAGTPPPTPTPVPVVRTTVGQGGSSLPKGFLGIAPFTTGAAGTLEVTVDWTFASNHIIVYVARGNCTFEQATADQCQFAAFSETTTPKPRTLTVSGAAAGTYTLLVGNLGPSDEAISFQVVLITGPGFSVVPQSVVSVRPTQIDRFVDGHHIR